MLGDGKICSIVSTNELLNNFFLQIQINLSLTSIITININNLGHINQIECLL